MEVFPLPRPLVDSARSKERKWWRRLLKVGGRSPNSTVFTLMGCDYSDITWRVQRCSLFLKLANSSVGSWTQLALITHHHLQTPWFREALDDLQLVLPGVPCVPTMVQTSPHLSSSARWSEENEWICILARALPTPRSSSRCHRDAIKFTEIRRKQPQRK